MANTYFIEWVGKLGVSKKIECSKTRAMIVLPDLLNTFDKVTITKNLSQIKTKNNVTKSI